MRPRRNLSEQFSPGTDHLSPVEELSEEEVNEEDENCEHSNVTKPDQLGQDNLARIDPAVGAMVLPPVTIICFEIVQNDSIFNGTVI